MENEETVLALGEAIRARRKKLGFNSAEDFGKEINLSGRTILDLETGRRTSFSSKTISALEKALRWRNGSIEGILNGTAPIPKEDIDSGWSLFEEESGVVAGLAYNSDGLSLEVDGRFMSVSFVTEEMPTNIVSTLGKEAILSAAYRAKEELDVSLLNSIAARMNANKIEGTSLSDFTVAAKEAPYDKSLEEEAQDTP